MSWDPENYRTLKANGLCPGCKSDPQPGRIHCRSCVLKTTRRLSELNPTPERIEGIKRAKRNYVIRTYAKRVNSGLCADCGTPRPATRVRCLKCRRVRAALARVHNARPVTCGYCHQVGHNKRTCEKLERAKAGR